VSQWTDLSSNGNNAFQGVTAYEPTYTASAVGGLPSATFTGPTTFLQMMDSATLQWGTSDFVVLAVIRGSPVSQVNGMIYQKSATPSPFDGVNLYIDADEGTPTHLAGAEVSHSVYVLSAPPPSTFADGSVHLLGVLRSGTALELRVDGAVSGATTSPQVAMTDVSAVGKIAAIGQNGYNTQAEFQQFHGDVAEILAIYGPSAAMYLPNLELYLKMRYAIP
jgi:hypothetical protein